MKNLFIVVAGLSGALSVGLGAFGAHALKGKITPELLNAYQTGVNYQAIHTLALLAVALMLGKSASSLLYSAGALFILGMLCFSGSLYILATTSIRWVGPVTPIGGLLLILGWLCIAISALR